MISRYLKFIITSLSLITLNNWLISQTTFFIGDKFHKTHSEKHIFQYRFYIDKADEIQLHFLSESITHFNLPQTISKEVSYSGFNERHREIITSISYKNILKKDSLILKTINDTTLINSETFNYDINGRLLEQISVNKKQNNQAYDTIRYRNMYSDTLENGINVTYINRYKAINSDGESLYNIEKITNDSIGRVKFSELIYPSKEDKFVVEFLYSKTDSNVGTKTYVNDSLVYNSEIDTLIYEDTCIVEYYKDIEPIHTKSEIEIFLKKSLKGLRNELNKPYKCGEKHIIIYSPDSRRSIRIEYSGSEFGKNQLINYSYTMITEEK